MLYMPETFIIYRMKYEDNLREDWREKFLALDADERLAAEQIIAANKFSDSDIAAASSEKFRALLRFYRIRRNH